VTPTARKKMIIESKYDIGQVVQFQRPIKQVNGKTRTIEVHVGFIEKIHINKHGIRYSIPSGGNRGFPGLVPESDVLCVMYPECYFYPSLTD
jgi:hypothetical protein